MTLERTAMEITAIGSDYENFVLIEHTNDAPYGPKWCRWFWKEQIEGDARRLIPNARVQVQSVRVSERNATK